MFAAMAPARHGRKLKRNASREAVPVTVGIVTCIRGGMRKHWIVLETRMHCGRECASIGSRQVWLHQLLAGTMHKSKYHHTIGNFVAECMEAAKTRNAALSQDVAPLQDVQPAASASSQGAPALAGRLSIVRKDSSDDEGMMPTKRRKKKAGRGRASISGFVELTVRDIEITCNVRGRRVLVPIDTGDLGRIVSHLKPRAGEVATDSASGFGKLLGPGDAKRIAWRSSALSQGPGCWQIVYEDKGGSAIACRSGMQVPHMTLAGEPMNLTEQRKAAADVLKKARRTWNRLDCSDRDRSSDEEP